MTAPTPADETDRQAALDALGVLDTLPEQAYDDLTRAAAELFGAPIALISMVDRKRQWFKARTGTQETQMPREHSFCAHAVADPNQPLVVTDARADARFCDNPLVTGDPNIRFYAGIPLTVEGGHAVGTLCVIDRVPREARPDAMAQLQFLAEQVMRVLAERASSAAGLATPTVRD
ncbi:MAG: GAF domain-containing protein [Rubrivivax sp.]